ncbi:hypothetical protein [Desulfospira joergensenii]|uniref:hypothetical protein n=1 Tax=Desulfospira joergensenii TaxID=53329 RepID=UPI0003B4F729|nr:hypothetical protein [Desulfospira joergensenii]
MFLKYKGRKEQLKLTRPELEKKYTFKGDKPVDVSDKDGELLLETYPRSFELVEEEKDKDKGKGK